MIKITFRLLTAITALGLISCSTGVEMPKGTRKGYSSARITVRDPAAPAIMDATEKQVHGMTGCKGRNPRAKNSPPRKILLAASFGPLLTSPRGD